MRSARRRRSIGFALGGVAALGAGWLALESRFFRNVEHVSYDLRAAAARPPAIDPRIVHINIDDPSVRPEVLGRWPWPRDVHARLVDLLTQLGAGAIVFDVEFVEPQAPYLDPERADEVVRAAELVIGKDGALVPVVRESVNRARKLLDAGKAEDADAVLMQLREDLGPYEGKLRLYYERLLVRPDEELAESIRRSGHVLLPIRITSERGTNPHAGPLRDSSWAVPGPDPWPISGPEIECPQSDFASGSNGFGVTSTPVADGDRIVRRVRILHRHQGRVYAKLGVKSALDRVGTHWSVETSPRSVRFRSVRAEFELPVDEEGATLLDWPQGPVASLFAQYSYGEVVAPARLAHRIDALFGKLEALVRILELEGLPDWPARGAREYIKEETWERQERFLGVLGPKLAALDPAAPYKSEARALATAYVAQVRELHRRRMNSFAKIREAFRGKIVFVGSTQTSSTDLKATPMHPDMPGVFFHSTAANMVLQRRFVHPIPRRTTLLLVLGVALAATAIASFGRPAITGPLTVLVVAAYVATAFGAFSAWRLVLPVIAPVSVAFVPYGVVLAWRLATEERERRLVRTLFSHYLSPELVDRLVEEPSRAGFQGERREITVLFSDVHGFTSFVENNPSDLVVRTLNEYLQTITEVILRNGGYVDKYLGDGILALFGISEGTPEQAAMDACRTAIRAQERLKEFRKRQEGLSHPLQETRFGIASGMAVVGNVGMERKLNFTAIGDAVNVAARLQILNKKLKTLVLIDESTYRRVADNVATRGLGPHEIEGREKPVCIYELEGLRAQGGTEFRRR